MDAYIRSLENNGVAYWMAYETLLMAVNNVPEKPVVVTIQVFVEDMGKVLKCGAQPVDFGAVFSCADGQVHVYAMRKEFDYVVRADAKRHYGDERYEYNFLFPLVRIGLAGVGNLYAPRQAHEWLWRIFGAHYQLKLPATSFTSTRPNPQAIRYV